jgi:hypothetical protein
VREGVPIPRAAAPNDRLAPNCALGRAIQHSGKMKFLSRHKHIALSGKSVLIYRNRVKPRQQKYFASHFRKSEV